MDSLIKQMRKRSPGHQERTGEVSGTSREKRIPPRKSVSFKEEKKKSPNWFQRQFSRQMSGSDYDPTSDYDPLSDLDHAAAVAAAAYAITSLEETWTQTHNGYELETAIRKPKSRREEILPVQEPRRSSSRRLSEVRTNEHLHDTTEQFSFKESERNGDNTSEPKSPTRKPRGKSPSMRKTATFAINLGGSDTKQTEDSADKPKKNVSPDSEPQRKLPPTRTRSDRSVPPPPPPPPHPRDISKQSPARYVRSDDSAADAWEKAELAKIKERFEKLNRKIDSWEAKKRDKARRKLKKTEMELEQKRKRALERFREDTEYIDQIASGARAQAEKQRSSEETKVKEKADVIRRTGQLPAKTCLCF